MASRSPSGSPERAREGSPLRAIARSKGVDESSDIYRSAFSKLYEASRKFDKEKDTSLLKTFESRELDKEAFRLSLRLGMNCKLSPDEMDSLVPFFDNGGFVDGTEFLLLFYKIRYDYRSKVLTDRINKERKMRSEARQLEERRLAEWEKKNHIKLLDSVKKVDLDNALAKLTEAAVLYDRLMPGAVQLDAFECEYMRPDEFKEQLRRVFNLPLTAAEFSALFKHLNKDNPDSQVVGCASFLVMFFRLGFSERNERIRAGRAEKKRLMEERELKRREDQLLLEQKNSLKCSYEFTPEDKERALRKLRAAAKSYDKTMPGCLSLEAFEVATMPPHVFKEQLKRVFNLKLTPAELGALVQIFDEREDGCISCSEFTKSFLAIGFAEREKDLRVSLQRQRKADEDRKTEHERKMQELESKNALKISLQFNEDDMASAMEKLTDAAWRFDRHMPGAPNLDAFLMQDMEPHIFKEQLKRAFSMKIIPQELGALMAFFDKKGAGRVNCAEFLNYFLKLGIDERDRRRREWRVQQAELADIREKQSKEKKLLADQKLNISIETFTEDDFNSAMSKLTVAAFKYSKNGPGAVGLDGFEVEFMKPHEFKEQLKLVFNVKVNNPEFGALMSYFDKEGTGNINCKEFLIQFFRTGYEERHRTRLEWLEEQRVKREKDKIVEEQKKKEILLRSMQEVDYDFTEHDFDAALTKLINISHQFDPRQLGPAGFGAFTADLLTPSEFREMVKRTFNVKFPPYELGAIVTYFDTNMKGAVSCSAFLNSFVQLRVRCEEFKGKPNEQELLKAYHAELKDAYKQRLQRRVIASQNGENHQKPWRAANAAMVVGASKIIKQKRPYPITAVEKLKLRLIIARGSGRLDLSTKASWAETIEPGTGTRASIAVNNSLISISSSDIGDGEEVMGAIYRENFSWASKAFGSKFQPDAVSKVNESKDELVKVDFRLTSIPSDVFKISKLTELWLTNNSITVVPAQIGDLKQLKILSISHNNLERLPPEIGLLEHLKRLLLNGNRLSSLPELFSHLRNLTELILGDNAFSEFPVVLTRLPDLFTLDFSKNQLTTLPSSLIKMRSLNFLSLEKNPGLAGHAPVVLAEMHWLSVEATQMTFPATPRACDPFKITKDEEDELEGLLRNRGHARITAKLRRRKKVNKKANMTTMRAIVA